MSNEPVFVFGCSEVGPSKYIAELAEYFSPQAICTSSSINAPIFQSKKLIMVDSVFKLKNVSLIVMGTSAGGTLESLDKKLIAWGRKLSVPTVAIVEHWSWARERFYIGENLFLPSYIIVNDEIAMRDALKQGLPKEIIKPLGNPYLEKISKSKLSQEKKPHSGNTYRFPKEKRLIFFISEELKDAYILGTTDETGYDEYQVLHSILSKLSSDDHLIIKMHPEENIKKYDYISSKNITILKECSITDIVNLAHKVVGMASMLLLEISIFRGDVISYRPNATKEFIGNELGITIPVHNSDQLHHAINSKANFKSKFGNRFEGSLSRITSFLSRVALKESKN